MTSEIILPAGVELGAAPEQFPQKLEGRGVVVNETDLPDEAVYDAIVEQASLMGLSPSNSLQMYGAAGNLMTRPKWRPPTNVVEEIMMCRELAERDDDVAAVVGMMIALAYGEGMQHSHRDEVTVAVFDEVADEAGLIQKFKEMYREWLIAHQVTTAVVWRQASLSFTPTGADRQRTRSIMVPQIAVLPAEQIRVIGNDIFGTARLAYRPFSGRQEQWLQEYFSNSTTAARKAEMRREDPILTTLLTEQVAYDNSQEGGAQWVYGDLRDPAIGNYVYTLSPQYVQRVTGPKGQWQHPRPMMTRNLPLLEAKRLLTVMDYTLLEAGANFLLVVKKGSDQRPALPQELASLKETVMRASRSGVMIGDHRLNVDVIVPELTELLNPDKRKLIGRKLAAALLRVPDIGTADSAGAQEMLTDTEILSRVIASDRDDLRRHMRRAVYKPTAERNDIAVADMWFPKIVLQGLQFFNDMILGLRDRGDIPRQYAVEAAGFSWDAAVETRKREKADDKIMTPAAVPFSSPNAAGGGAGGPGPQDRGGGRPKGASTGRAKPQAPGTGKKTVHQNAGETIKAMWDGDDGPIYRAGETTYAILEEYAEVSKVGRVSKFERRVLERIEAERPEGFITEGPVTALPVNLEYAIDEIQAVRLSDSVSILVGRRPEDEAVVARALVFRDPVSRLDAEETALRWGYHVDEVSES